MLNSFEAALQMRRVAQRQVRLAAVEAEMDALAYSNADDARDAYYRLRDERDSLLALLPVPA